MDTSVANKGKALSDVKERQRRRKMAHIKESTKCALDFTKSYHIDLQSISFTATDSQDSFVIKYTDLNSSQSSQSDSSQIQLASESPSQSTSTQLTLTSSPESLETQTPAILYLLDKYGVSDDFYHELTMLNSSLPQSHKVKQLRKGITESIPFTPVASPHSGYYKPFERSLNEALVNLQLQGVELKSPIEVKLSGDGAPFYRSTSFVLLSFSFPSLDPSSSSATGKQNKINDNEYIKEPHYDRYSYHWCFRRI